MGCLLGHIETRIEMVFLLYTQRDPHCCESLLSFIPGSVLLSHPVAREVPSALEVLTAVFEMGTGITPPLWPPGNVLTCMPLQSDSRYDIDGFIVKEGFKKLR